MDVEIDLFEFGTDILCYGPLGVIAQKQFVGVTLEEQNR